MAQEPEVPLSLKRSVFGLARDVVRQARGGSRRRLAGPGAESAGSMPASESETAIE
jgi:hypothetical protein